MQPFSKFLGSAENCTGTRSVVEPSRVESLVPKGVKQCALEMT